jgi:hypothetical protein
MEVLGPLVRIALRYLGGALIAKGYSISPDNFTDPDLVQVICYAAGAFCAVLSEGWYKLAHKRGWRL